MNMDEKIINNLIDKNYLVGKLKKNSLGKFKKSANEVFYFETCQNKYVLKIYKTKTEHLDNNFDILYELKSKYNLPFIVPIKTINKKYSIKFEDFKLVLFPFVKGKEYSSNNDSHLILAANTLGKFHKVSRDIINNINFQNQKDIFNLNYIKKIIIKISNLKSDSIYLEIFQDYLSKINLELSFIESNLEKTKSNFLEKSSSLIHADYWPEQLLYSENEIVGILDSDDLVVCYPEWELISAVRKFSKVTDSNSFRGKFSYFDLNKINIFLSEYKKTFGQIALCQLDVSVLIRKSMLDAICFFISKILDENDIYWVEPLNDMFKQLIWFKENENEFVKNILF